MDKAFDTIKPADPATVAARLAASKKYDGPGYYVFGYDEPGFFKKYYFAEPDRGGYLPGFIDLSSGPGEPVEVSIAATSFDECCRGQRMSREEAEGACQ